jgi:hypothetical protein
MQTFWAIVSLIFRVALLGIAVPVLLANFPNFSYPRNPSQEWLVVTGCSAFAVVAPLLKDRKIAFLAGALSLGARYYYHPHYIPALGLAYMGVAIVLVLLPASGRSAEMVKREQMRRR